MDLTDLEETARLAHLTLSEQELLAALPAVEEWLSFFATMWAADSDEVFTVADVIPSAQVRTDTEIPPATEGASDSLLSAAGARDGRFIVIPGVLP